MFADYLVYHNLGFSMAINYYLKSLEIKKNILETV